MIEVSLSLSVITLTTNGLNFPIKTGRLAEWVKTHDQKKKQKQKQILTHDPTLCCLWETLFYFILFGHATACWILVPWPGSEPMPPAVEAQSPNHWTAREFPERLTLEQDKKEGSFSQHSHPLGRGVTFISVAFYQNINSLSNLQLLSLLYVHHGWGV